MNKPEVKATVMHAVCYAKKFAKLTH